MQFFVQSKPQIRKRPQVRRLGAHRVAGWTGLENEIEPASMQAHASPSCVLDGESPNPLSDAASTPVHTESHCRNVATDPVRAALEQAAAAWNLVHDIGQLRRSLLDVLLLLDR